MQSAVVRAFGSTQILSRAASTYYRLPDWLRGRPGRTDEAVHLSAEPVVPGEPVVLEPGLVVLRGALCREDQVVLAANAWEAGCSRHNSEHSFFEADGSLRGPKGRRGRIFDSCTKFDESLTGRLLPACADWVRRVRAVDPMMPHHHATHLLLLYYPRGGSLGFHRDEQANDGTGDEPVVNLSLGDEMDFAVRHSHADVARVVTLRSGDVILFGGPCRRILHAVVDVRPGDNVLPPEAAGGRLSFTLRHAPEVCGHEHLYQDFRPQADDPGTRATGDELLLGGDESVRRLSMMSR